MKLDKESSKKFMNDMTHIDHENQKRIDDFIKGINETVTLMEGINGTIFAKVDFIDVDTIVELLKQK